MSDCSNHKKEVAGISDMKVLAEMIGDLHYEALSELFDKLCDKFILDSAKDSAGGRKKLAGKLQEAAITIEEAWKISKPFMKATEQTLSVSEQKDPQILKLTLHRTAFEVMVTGEKRLEFRKPGQWINSRLFNKDGSKKNYDFIKFTNGYGMDKPYFICKFLGFTYEYGHFHYSNGLEVDVSNDYALKCGEIVEVGNWAGNNKH